METYQDQSLRGKVFQKLREDILSGVYQDGDELREAAIGEEMGVSRTPVREALRQLELEGLVALVPNRGAYVTGITRKDVCDIYKIRSLLEGLCARWATEHITEKQIEALEEDHWLRKKFEEGVAAAVQGVERIKDVAVMVDGLQGIQEGTDAVLSEMDLATGAACITVSLGDDLFYQILSEYAGQTVEGPHSLIPLVRDSATAAREWSYMADAWADARQNGYGVVSPRVDDMYLEEPELIKQGGHFGVRLCASAPSYHIIKANIGTEITPLIGTERQCEDLVRYIMDEFEDDPQKIWNTNVFGKSLSELVEEGIQGKIYEMPENAQAKLQQTLQRIINDGGGGLICIIL